MGTWNTKINANDSFQDIYQKFFDAYNQGLEPADISKQIQKDYAEMFEDSEDRHNSLFGLALAQWETRSLEEDIYKQVKEIVESGNDLEVWKGLGADKRSIKQRKAALDRFLIQISTDREKPKRRVRPKLEFEMINLVEAIAPDNLKTFSVNEEYTNKNYIHTSGMMNWRQGGGSILYFAGQGKYISAKWLDSNTLEVTHDKDIVFSMQKASSYFFGDQVSIIYEPKH